MVAMNKKFVSFLQSLTKRCIVFVCAALILFSQADTALAARSGGSFGGGSFRRPPMTRMAPARRSAPSGYGYPAPYGGGFGFPFWIPFFTFGGGGSLFSLLILMAVAGVIISGLRNAFGSSDGQGYTGEEVTNPTVSVNTLQVGLLAQARSLQTDLDRIALNASTASSAGLADALQETTLALLRHPEYWVYGSADGQKTRLLSAEAEFNRRSLSERSKFQEETLSNVNQQLRQKAPTATLPSADDLATQASSEYIVVTLIVASQGKLDLPNVQSAEDVRKALNLLGTISSDHMLAMRVHWTPQAEGDTLTSDDVVAAYPALHRL
jgi:uncharacterized membrane protein